MRRASSRRKETSNVSRPRGVTLIAIASFAGALLLLLLPFLGQWHGHRPFPPLFFRSIPASWIRLFMPLLGLATGWAAWLLYRLHPIGWWLFTVGAGWDALCQLAGWSHGYRSALPALGVDVLLIVYLFSVRRSFEGPASAT
jgi:hypothetical protein